MKFKPLAVLTMFALAALVSTAAQSRADDDQDQVEQEKPRKIEARIVVDATAGRIAVADAAGKYWIGVYAVPVDEALKSHLGVKQKCLLVQEVIDESPAKKAGLQKYDVLLTYGDDPIATVEDLMKAVERAGDTETVVFVIRGGKKKSLKVTAAERPANQHEYRINLAEDGDVQGLLNNWVERQGKNAEGGGPIRFRIIGPGVVNHDVDVAELHKAIAGSHKMPENLSIQITKSGDKPAQIKVTRDNKSWEVAEDKLDELPEDIRVHVKRSLGGRAGAAIGFGTPDGPKIRLKALQIHSEGELDPGPLPRVIKPGEPVPLRRSIQIWEKPGNPAEDVEQLRKDVEQLKAAVKKLQEGKPKKKKDDN